ncbi:putative EG45-like domain containing protein 1 [Daucus carota subsp. sativus]|uniref:putative EG45-like domain containing protein 1 n=1 Tax=Daucus carota subsp. sativus TaxID=79200 RepID=UPI00308385A0
MATSVMHLFTFISVVSVMLSPAAYATPGTATFYTNYVPSACYGDHDSGVMIAAASDPLWDNGAIQGRNQGGPGVEINPGSATGAICGKTFTVKCTGPANPVPHPCTGESVTVKVVDHCPGCGGTLDLSKEAFKAIADPVAGIIKID